MENRVCIVTGAASGIGFTAAGELLKQGWRVALLDFQAEALSRAESQLQSLGECKAFKVDITDAAGVEGVVSTIAGGFGTISGVVNSAGIARDVPFLETTAELFQTILSVNVIGSFIVARAAAARMIGGGTPGAIVNLASVSGIRGSLGRTAYGASKGAVITMTKVMAVELALHSIRVNAVAPGPVDTPMVQTLHDAETRRGWLRTIPQARYATPYEIASAIAFLLDGERASFVTGQILAVDGGFEAGGLIARS